MAEPDLRRLTPSERTHYDSLLTWQGRGLREQVKASGGYFQAVFILLALAFGLGVPAVIIDMVNAVPGVQSPLVMPLLWITFLGAPLMITLMVLGSKAQLRYLQASQRDYLKRINYQDRWLPKAAHNSDDTDTRTRRQQQHDWYEGHGELNWTDRQRAQSYGIDVEEYLSNFPQD